MKKLNLLALVCAFALAGCTEEPEKPSVGDRIVCGVLDVAASTAALQVQEALSCENYAAIKADIVDLSGKIYACDGVSAKLAGPVCRMAMNTVLSTALKAGVPADWGCSTEVPGSLKGLVDKVCEKVPF